MTNDLINRRLLMGAAAFSPLFAAVSITTADAAGDPLIIIAELVSNPGQADALRDLLVPFASASRQEPGCEHYTLLEDLKQSGRFLTYEVWTDQSALAAHMQTPTIKELGPKLSTILAKPFTQAFLEVVSSN